MDDSVGARVSADWAAPILPERGLVFSEVKHMQLQLCKPKLLPIKSYSLEKLEKIEKKLAQSAKEKRDGERALRHASVGWTSPDLREDVPAAAAETVKAAHAPPLPTAIPASPPRVAAVAAPLQTSKAAVSSSSPPEPSSVPVEDRAGRRATTAGRGSGGADDMSLAEVAAAAGQGEEEDSADAPMSPHEQSGPSVPGSGVSASSSSTTEYE